MTFPFEAGQTFEETFVVSEGVYGGFMELFGDRNPLHTEESFAVVRGFRGCVMHGNILNGFLSFLIGEGLPVKEVVIHSQEINYTRPVYLGDTLTLTARVREVHESVNAVEFTYQFVKLAGEVAARGKFQIGLLSGGSVHKSGKEVRGEYAHL